MMAKQGGYLRICREGRDSFEQDFPKWLAEPPLEFTEAAPEERGPRPLIHGGPGASRNPTKGYNEGGRSGIMPHPLRWW